MIRAERWVARVLVVGGLLGIVAMTIGVVGSAVHAKSTERPIPGVASGHDIPATSHAPNGVPSLAKIRRAVARRSGRLEAVAELGTMMLLLTPVVAVATAGLAFAVEGDFRFVLICLVLVLALGVSWRLGGA
jgi:uncharacterized membrane protein